MSEEQWQSVSAAGGGKKKNKKKNKGGNGAAAAEGGPAGAINPKPTMYDEAERALKEKQERKVAQEAASESAAAAAAAEEERQQRRIIELAAQQSGKGGGKKSKKKAASKPEGSPAEPAVAELDMGAVLAAMTDAKDKFKGKPIEWVQAGLGVISSKLSGCADEFGDPPSEPITGKDKIKMPAPMRFLPSDKIKALFKAFSGMELTVKVRAALFEIAVESLVNDQLDNGGKMAVGIRLCIQLLIEYERVKNEYSVLAGLAGLFTRYAPDGKKSPARVFPAPAVAKSVMWAYSQVLPVAPRIYLHAWKEMMLPLLLDDAVEEVKDFALASLRVVFPGEDVESPQTTVQRLKMSQFMSARQLINLMRAAFSIRVKLSEDQRKELQRVYPYFRELMLRNNVQRLFNEILPISQQLPKEETRLQHQVLLLLNLAISRDPSCFEAMASRFVNQKGKDAPAIMNVLIFAKQFIGQEKYSPLNTRPAEALKCVQAMRKGMAAHDKPSYDKQRVENICQAVENHVETDSDSPYLLWAALIISTLLLIVLSTHLLCRVNSAAHPWTQATCAAMDDSGITRGVDRFYAKLEPMAKVAQPYVEKAQPYAEAAWDACKPAVSVAGEYIQKASNAAAPHIKTASDAAAPYVAQLGNILAAAWGKVSGAVAGLGK